jgi:tetratricopeptide (TPR) repeat protein
MKCSKCGAEIKVGSVYCYQCGNEAQLVPDYNKYEDDLFASVKEEEEKRQAAEEKKRQQERRRKEQQLLQEQQKKKDQKRLVLTILLLVVAAAAIAGIAVGITRTKQNNSYEYQLKQAQNAYDRREYEQAMMYANRALQLSPDSMDAMYELGRAYNASGQTEDAIESFEQLILEDPLGQSAIYSSALKQLLKLLSDSGNYDRIAQLYEQALPGTASLFSAYIIASVTFSEESGTYDSFFDVTLQCAEQTASIYYTLDGSEPDVNAEKYIRPIELREQGTYTIRAIAITSKGVKSLVSEAEYTIALSVPDYPEIYPASGTYSEAQSITVNVPDGMRAYYAWDSSQVSMSSKQYTGSLTMLEGNHVLSVILVNENNMASGVEKRNYIYYPVTQEPQQEQEPDVEEE